MSKLSWDGLGEKKYELGVDHGVLYPQVGSAYPKGVAWNGLTTVTESPEGAEANDVYADNIKYASIRSAETWKGTIEAYTYPDEFMACDGTQEIAAGIYVGQQARQPFGFCYRNDEGDDLAGNEDGHKIHIIYGCTASPSEQSHETINDSPEPQSFSWEIDSTPVPVKGKKATATVVIDTSKVSKAAMEKLEAALYGTETTDPYLPLPDEIIELVEEAAVTVTIEDPVSSEIEEGITLQLVGAASDGSELTWTSSDETKATVDSTGLVSALAAGAVTITATSGEASASVELTVKSAVVPVTVTIEEPASTDVVNGTTLQLVGAASDGSTLTWTSSDNTIATVDSTGLVTADSTNVGAVTITATSGEASDSVELTVTVS